MSRFEGTGYGRFCRVPCDQRDDKVKMGPDTDYDGDGMFAVERITTDESICCVQHGVMVALQTPRLQGHCYHCYNRVTDPGDLRPRGVHASTMESRELTECGGCGVVKFCSADCEKNAYQQYHQHECPVFQAFAPRVMPMPLRAVLRFLLLQKVGRLYGEIWNDVIGATSLVEQVRERGGKLWEDMCVLTQCVIEYSGGFFGFEIVLKLFAILAANGFALTDAYFQVIGITMHPLIGKINHNCEPNAVIKCDGTERPPRIEICPLEVILPGEEITIAYIEPSFTYEDRQKYLQDHYHFRCKCGKCAEEKDEFQRNFEPRKPIEMGLSLMEQLQHKKTTGTTTTYTQQMRYTLHQALVAGRPLTIQPFPIMLRDLAHAYVDESQFNLAFVFAAILVFRVNPEIYHADVHPAKMADQFLLYRITDCILHAKAWEIQKLDLASRELHLVYLHTWLLEDLHKLRDRSREGGLHDYMYNTWMAAMTDRRRRPVAYLNKEERKKVMVNIDVLLDEKMMELKAWK